MWKAFNLHAIEKCARIIQQKHTYVEDKWYKKSGLKENN